MTRERTLHLVVPDGMDDPLRPSGGNTYDLRLCQSLVGAGWTVSVHPVIGGWPRPDVSGRRALAAALATVPAGSLLLVDGLVASAAPAALVPAARRSRLVVLVHLPLGVGGADATVRAERAVLAAAAAVVVTSGWTRRWLVSAYGLDPVGVHVARPGVDPASTAVPNAGGGRLLCVGAVVPPKGHDVLATALATLTDLPWRCVCIGPLTRDPPFVRRLHDLSREAGIEDRLVLSGPLPPAALAGSYADADVLVHPSRAETYGMVVTEALARGLPVVAADAGGVSEALGTSSSGRPGVLLPVGDATALASALRSWLTQEEVRTALRRCARRRRRELDGWPETARRVTRVLEEAMA